ncbi:putative fatty acyl-CoA reductase CG5065 [Bicyclus anynana]|uniref:Fatty acyl-CoA reductase n=1 Tax=Bicyclus anynana TaxID=110368 RepID=A0A6J1PBZ0_BICAN|nr:putative fatty acyl-CoA reductase CG5065 [Bicyclus anynana]
MYRNVNNNYKGHSVFTNGAGSRVKSLLSSATDNTNEYQSIAECYEGQSVFITGGTGFVGKVLLEKLLYSCPGIDKVYLLVRETQGATAHQRMQKLLEEPVFSRIKEENPQAFEKVIPIVGDITQPQLGIMAENEELLIKEVSFVYHVAATTKFNETLDIAMNVNVAGTGRVLDLSKRMENIKAFVYVSTAYSNTDREVVEEVLYPAPVSLNEVNKLLKIGITDAQVKELIKGRPNTYTFTKALAENLVADNHGDVPAIIVRPSIVSSSKKEPVTGWIDSWYGATFLATVTMKGFNRVFVSSYEYNLDFIPVDYVSNLIIVAAARCKCSDKVDVYNSSTSGENPLKIGAFFDDIIAYSCKHKFYDIPLPMAYLTRYRWVMFLITLLLQTLPAYIADLFLLIVGKKPRYVKLASKISAAHDVLDYFPSRTWSMSARQTTALFQSLSPSDRDQFPCDPTDIDWKEYIVTYCQGIRQFLCKS